MRFVLAKGQSQYGSLRLHVDQMAAALQGLGHEVEVIDLMRPEGVAPLLMALSRPTDCYFTFNGVACEVAIDGARFERPPFLYASMHVDHPVHHLPRIASKISRDMLELGAQAADHHANLAGPLAEAQVDLVFCAGPLMRALWDALPAARRGAHAETAEALGERLVAAVQPGDVVMIKGSNGSKAGAIVARLIQAFHDHRAGEGAAA